MTHLPVEVREINIKENPDVSCYQPRGQGHVKDGSDAILDCCVLRFMKLTAQHTIQAPGTSNVLRGYPSSCQKLVVVAGADLRHTVHIVRPKCRNVTRLTRLRISLCIHHNSGHTGGIEPPPPSVTFRCSTNELPMQPQLCARRSASRRYSERPSVPAVKTGSPPAYPCRGCLLSRPPVLTSADEAVNPSFR